MMANTVARVLRDAATQIDRLDAQYLLAHMLNVSRASLIAHDERQLTPEEASKYALQIGERARGVPVAQIIGEREFYGRHFDINTHVLIPRPETEILVEQALACFSNNKCLKAPVNISVLDLGTGSGAVAVTLACEAPALHVTAVDKSSEALALARNNAHRHHASIRFLQSDWYQAVAGERFDCIVSNPPYVAGNDPHLTQGDLRFEPQMALTDGSTDGLDAIRAIVAGATAHLHSGGWLMFEHGYDQAERCRVILGQAGFANVTSCNDLAGIARVTMGQSNGIVTTHL